MTRERTWQERHPFLYGISMTFGIFPPRRYIPTAEESIRSALNDIEEAIRAAERMKRDER